MSHIKYLIVKSIYYVKRFIYLMIVIFTAAGFFANWEMFSYFENIIFAVQFFLMSAMKTLFLACHQHFPHVNHIKGAVRTNQHGSIYIGSCL